MHQFIPVERPDFYSLMSLNLSCSHLGITLMKRSRFLSPPSSSIDLSASPRVFEIGESSQTVVARHPTILTFMTHLESHKEQIDAISNHLDEFPLERIEQIEYGIEGLIDGQMRHDDEVVLTRVRISIMRGTHTTIHRMAPKRKSTSAAPAMTQAAIWKLVADSVAAALEA
ncbi:hypothetical protein Tco_0006164 [Tanacetum coccineum]